MKNRFTEMFLTTVRTEPISDDPEFNIELSRLKLLLQETLDKRQELVNKFGIQLDSFETLVARVNFLTDHIYGRNTSLRLQLEQEWLKNHILPALHNAHNQVVQQSRAAKLHVPGKGIHLVKPNQNGKQPVEDEQTKPEENN